jgi:alpha-L-fucosidase
MKLARLLLYLTLLVGVIAGQGQVRDKPLPASLPRPSEATVQQWQARKFGMFIHFGLYSEFGGVYHGEEIGGYSEQIMGNANIPVDEYAAVAKTFNPVKWNADAVVALAKSAGMKYIVITSKHHDGFGMFATRQTKYNVMDATPYHRDVVKELADACRRAGMPFGVYYSLIDWHEPGMDHYIEGNSNELSEAHARFNTAQIRELMSNYGPISEIWFDMSKPTPEQSRLFATTVHDIQPQTMVSGRVWNYQGDFTVMGDNEVPQYGIDDPWQTPASMFNETWGYRSWQKRGDVEGKIRENIVKLVQVASRGGNFILNIGPEGDGSIVPYEADVLRGMGAWLKANGEAIYGTQASPFSSVRFGYVTVKGTGVYLLIKDPTQRIVLPRTGRTQWVGASLLGSRMQLKIHREGEDSVVDSPKEWPGGFLPVIKLTTTAGLLADRAVPAWDEHGLIMLRAEDAQKFYNYNGRGYEEAKTLYKLRWYLPAGCAALTLHGSGSGAVALVANGEAVAFQAADGAVREVSIGSDNELEITPPEPFVKGTALPLAVTSIDLRRCSTAPHAE